MRNNVEWRHYLALLNHGVPSPVLLDDGEFTFRVIHRYGREFVVTDSSLVHAYFDEVVLPLRLDTPA